MSTTTLNQHRVLILNKAWTAIGVSSLKRAITLLFSTYNDGIPKARIISDNFQTYTWSDWSEMVPDHDEAVISTKDQRFRIPEVVLLTRYNKFPNQNVSFSRRALFKRDSLQCQYCGERPGSEELTIDHVVPRAQGGDTSWTNCVLCCVQCNSQKADNKPEEAFKNNNKNWKGPSPMELLNIPVKPKFSIFKDYKKNHVLDSWKSFISEAYWNTPLEN